MFPVMAAAGGDGCFSGSSKLDAGQNKSAELLESIALRHPVRKL